MNNLAKQSLLAQVSTPAHDICWNRCSTWRQREGPEALSTLISMNNLAEVLRAQGDRAARVLLEPALDTMKRQFGPQHPRTLACLHNLAETLRAQGKVATARPMLAQALEARQQVLGPGILTPLSLRGAVGNFAILGEQRQRKPSPQSTSNGCLKQRSHTGRGSAQGAGPAPAAPGHGQGAGALRPLTSLRFGMPKQSGVSAYPEIHRAS